MCVYLYSFLSREEKFEDFDAAVEKRPSIEKINLDLRKFDARCVSRLVRRERIERVLREAGANSATGGREKKKKKEETMGVSARRRSYLMPSAYTDTEKIILDLRPCEPAE